MKKHIKKHLTKDIPVHIAWKFIGGHVLLSVIIVTFVFFSIYKAYSSVYDIGAHFDHPNPSGWPARGYISQGAHTFYSGGNAYDIAHLQSESNVPVYSSVNGTVAIAGLDSNETTCGQKVRINTDGGGIADFCHLASTNVNVGEFVRRGQVLGIMGNTGLVDYGPGGDGIHLHYWLSQPQYFPSPPCVGVGCNVDNSDITDHITNDKPAIKKIERPACTNSTYGTSSNSRVKIEWEGREKIGTNTGGGFWIDIDDQNPMVNPHNRNVNPMNGTGNHFLATNGNRLWVEAVNGDYGYGGLNSSQLSGWYSTNSFTGISNLKPNKIYYARVYNGLHSDVKSWMVPVCNQGQFGTLSGNFSKGDVNCDRTVNAVDALLVLQYVASGVPGQQTQPPGCAHGNFFANANVNNSCLNSQPPECYPEIDTIDAALIIQYDAGLLTSLDPITAAAGQADTDGDRLYDTLEDQYAVLNKFVADADANPDGDARVNSAEIAGNTDPGVYDAPLPENKIIITSSVDGFSDPGVVIERASGTSDTQGTTNYAYTSTQNINTLLRVPLNQLERPDGKKFYQWLGCDSIVGGTYSGAITGNECWVSASNGETRYVYADFKLPPLNTLNVESKLNGGTPLQIEIQHAAGTPGTANTYGGGPAITNYQYNSYDDYNTLLRVPASQYTLNNGSKFYRWLSCDSIVGGVPAGAITGNECWISGSNGSNKTVTAEYKPAASPSPTPSPTPPPVSSPSPTPSPISNQPDLVITNIFNYDTTPNVGDVLTFTARAQNNGNAATGADSGGIGFGIDTPVGNPNQNLGVPPSSQINAGAFQDRTSDSWTVTAGTHTIWACADYWNYFAETNDNNNCRSETFTVLSGWTITLGFAQKICDGTNERVRLTWTESIGTDAFDIYRSDLGYYTNNSSVGDFWEGPIPESGSYTFKVRNHDWQLTGGSPVESNEVTINMNACVGAAGTVISTELRRQDLISDDIWRGDVIYGRQTSINNPEVMEGYHFWARPVVKLMQKSETFSKLVDFIATPVLTQIAYEAGTVDNGSTIGNIILESGKTLSGTLGHFVNEPAYVSAER